MIKGLSGWMVRKEQYMCHVCVCHVRQECRMLSDLASRASDPVTPGFVLTLNTHMDISFFEGIDRLRKHIEIEKSK